jgi:hypothetical protein
VAGCQSKLQRDRSTQGVADEVSSLDVFRVHHGKSVLCHLRNRNTGAGKLALSHAAIVKRDAAEMGGQGLGLR